MALQKAGGTNVDATSSAPAAATNLVDFLETQLVNAGWTIISGAGTDAIKFETAAQADGHKIRIVTSVSGSDVGLELRNASESATGATANIRLTVDGVSDWIIMANRYSFCVYEDTAPAAIISGNAKKWAMAGVLYLESFLTPTVTEAGYLFGDHRSTSSATHYHSFRVTPALNRNVASNSLLYNGTIVDTTNSTSSNQEEGSPTFVVPHFPTQQSEGYSGNPTKQYQWITGEHFAFDPLLAWGANPLLNMAQARGQMFDIILVLDDNLTRNDTVTIGLDTFRVVNDPGFVHDHLFMPFAILFLKP